MEVAVRADSTIAVAGSRLKVACRDETRRGLDTAAREIARLAAQLAEAAAPRAVSRVGRALAAAPDTFGHWFTPQASGIPKIPSSRTRNGPVETPPPTTGAAGTAPRPSPSPRRVAGTQHGRAQVLFPPRSKVRNASSGS